jgi:hypothetical protein
VAELTEKGDDLLALASKRMTGATSPYLLFLTFLAQLTAVLFRRTLIVLVGQFHS